MDFERATLKALFYDYPIEAAVKALRKSETFGGKDNYLDRLPEFMRWREQAFTTTEARLIEELAKEKWLQVEGKSSPIDKNIYQALNMVRSVAEEILVEDKSDHNYPLVKFDYLFRWKDASLFIGEDLLTTAFVATMDTNRPGEDGSKLLLWPDYIHHNEKMLNAELDKGLSDVHAHYNASADVFHYNWISLTNALRDKGGDEQLKRLQRYQDVMLTTTDTNEIYSFKSLCVAAAYLRLMFFKKFVKQDKTIHVCHFKDAIHILEDEFYARYRQSDIQAEISVARMDALHTPNGRAMDYAIVVNNDTLGNRDDIHMLFQGERQLLYSFLLRYYRNCPDAWALAPYFYLYLLIKIRIRKEFVQINQLKGFENFETYQDRKSLFVKDNEAIAKEFGKYVLQTSVRKGKKDHIEARVTPNHVAETISSDFEHSVFSHNKSLTSAENKISFVAHFIKANPLKQNAYGEINKEGVMRFACYRAQLKKQIIDLLRIYNRQTKYSKWDRRCKLPKLVGIDAASTEMLCPPEVFGHVYRYAKIKGIYNRTYHVGEDFFDIVGGLRAIDEAMLFLDLDSNSRIGHALAMGVNAKQYYEDRKYRIIGTQQEVLDNCVWLLVRTSTFGITITNAFEKQLTQIARNLYLQIGYPGVFDVDCYWNSMLMRGDEPMAILGEKKDALTDWQKTHLVENKEVEAARNDAFAKLLYSLYHYCDKVKKNGTKHTEDKYLEEIVTVVASLQKKMQELISQKNIAIECNPTSNLKIGYFESYEEHPILTQFEPLESRCVDPIVNASVNTDDRGVFATTVYNELSLLALALKKKDVKCKDTDKEQDGHYNPRAICDYIGGIRQNGIQQQFKIK